MANFSIPGKKSLFDVSAFNPIINTHTVTFSTEELQLFSKKENSPNWSQTWPICHCQFSNTKFLVILQFFGFSISTENKSWVFYWRIAIFYQKIQPPKADWRSHWGPHDWACHVLGVKRRSPTHSPLPITMSSDRRPLSSTNLLIPHRERKKSLHYLETLKFSIMSRLARNTQEMHRKMTNFSQLFLLNTTSFSHSKQE